MFCQQTAWLSYSIVLYLVSCEREQVKRFFALVERLRFLTKGLTFAQPRCEFFSELILLNTSRYAWVLLLFERFAVAEARTVLKLCKNFFATQVNFT